MEGSLEISTDDYLEELKTVARAQDDYNKALNIWTGNSPKIT